MGKTKKRVLLKVILLGNSGVGKSSLLKRYVENKFAQSYRATIGSDFMSKEIIIDDYIVKLQLWDTAGQERFSSLGTAFYRGADACILVFDSTVERSFEDLNTWRIQFLNKATPPDPDNFLFVVICNKIDLVDQRAVDRNCVLSWCRERGNIPYFETSAKDATNVEQAFALIAQRAISNNISNADSSYNGVSEQDSIYNNQFLEKEPSNKCCP